MLQKQVGRQVGRWQNRHVAKSKNFRQVMTPHNQQICSTRQTPSPIYFYRFSRQVVATRFCNFEKIHNLSKELFGLYQASTFVVNFNVSKATESTIFHNYTVQCCFPIKVGRKVGIHAKVTFKETNKKLLQEQLAVAQQLLPTPEDPGSKPAIVKFYPYLEHLFTIKCIEQTI